LEFFPSENYTTCSNFGEKKFVKFWIWIFKKKIILEKKTLVEDGMTS
jgi:hypothetical protein